MAKDLPKYKKLLVTRKKLEKHFRDVQDVEFTIEEGKLWMLQTRNGKRTVLLPSTLRWIWLRSASSRRKSYPPYSC